MHRRIASTIVVLAFSAVCARGQYFYNQAALFDGSTSYIAVPNDSEVSPDTALTIEAWVFPTAYNPSGTSAIVSKNDQSSFALKLNQSGQVLFYPVGSPGLYLVSKSSTHIPLNTWTHIAATYDGTTTTILVNGTKDTSTTVIQGLIGINTDSLYIGGEFAGVFLPDFKGAIDEVRIWKVALFPSAIQMDQHVPLAIANPNPESYFAGLLDAWRLNGNAIDEGGFKQNNGFLHHVTFWDLRQKPVNYVDYNNAIILNTVVGYCAAPPSPSFDATTGLTLEAWVYDYFPSDTDFQAIVVKGGATTWDYGLFTAPVAARTHAGYRIVFAVNYGDTLASPVVPEETWMHVAATYDATTHRAIIYVDGDSVAGRTFVSTGLIPNDPDSLFIGDIRPSQNRYQFSGQLDEIRVWRNVVRTQDQIRTNMYSTIDFSTIPTPGSSLTVYGFDGKNTNDMQQYEGTPFLRFFQGARFASAHRQLGGEYTSPILRDDNDGFPGPTFIRGHRNIGIPDTASTGVVDSVYVSSSGPTTTVKVFALLMTSRVDNVRITLTCPTGVSATLFEPGEGAGSRDIMTVFSDAADSTGGLGGTGFTGPFSPLLRPSTPMSAFTGQSRQGWWKLQTAIVSNQFINLATLIAWGLQIYPLTGISPENESPVGFRLSQNYPNPFNPVTTIRGTWGEESRVKLEVYDLLGRKVATLADGRFAPGVHAFSFDGTNLASGVYFYRLEAGAHTAVRKMILEK
jgi:subtilisin-like proprotein convertase family protein